MSTSGESPFHVLLVDDSPTDRELAEKFLRDESYRVTAVESGSKALEFLGLLDDQNRSLGSKVDLIMTEFCMPGMSGYELLKKIKKESTLKDIPVVIVSCLNEPICLNRCREEGAVECIVKPLYSFDVEALRSHILGAKHKAEQQQIASNKGKATEEGQASTSTAAPQELHALVVDGSRIGRLCTENLLKRHFFRVTTVATVSKALDFLLFQDNKENEVDLIIADYYMPGTSGYELLEEVKAAFDLRDIPVAIMLTDAEPSDDSELEYIDRCRKEAEELIMKPLLPRDVKRLRSYALIRKARKDKEGLAVATKGKDMEEWFSPENS